MNFKIVIYIIPIIIFSFFAKAHPVIYKDGFVYWGEFSNQKNTQAVSYTFHPYFAFQFSSDFERHERQKRTYQLGFNVLLKRWFLEESQANIYTSFQGGVYDNRYDSNVDNTDESSKKDIALLRDRFTYKWSLSSDWESRKVYTAGMLGLKGILGLPKTLWGDFSYRIGFAPYVVGMDELQTWFVLMFQMSALGTFNKEMQTRLLNTKEEPFYRTTLKINKSTIGLNWKITPLLRFFYKNVLWEIGSSFQSDFYITLMVHY